MSLKNLWSLNIDETLVADRLKTVFAKSDYEVFFPVNSQMKDIDLLLVRMRDYKSVSVQVKGSRTYEPRKSEIERFGEGSGAWFRISRDSILEPSNRVDVYVFVLHSLIDTDQKRSIGIDYLVIPNKDFIKILSRKQLRKNNFYHFFIWIDPNGKRAFDFRDSKSKQILLSKYINNWEILKI